MKKKIIMLGIILVSSLSLLLVMFCIKTKDIKYISSNEINKYGITMLLEKEEGQTNITEVPNEGYYKIEYTCENNSAVIRWSNISHKIKIKATDIPVKCTLAFVEVTEDLNIISMYVNGTTSEYEVEELTNGTNYYLNSYTCKNVNGLDITSNMTVSFNNVTRETKIKPVTKKVYCNLYFTTTDAVYDYGTIADASVVNKRTAHYNGKLYINGIPHIPTLPTMSNPYQQIYNGNLFFGTFLTNGISTFGPTVDVNRFTPVSGVNTRTVSIAANRTVLVYAGTGSTGVGGQKFYNLKISTNGTTYYNLSEAVTNGIIRPIVLISHQAIDFDTSSYLGNTGDNTKLLNIYDTSDEIIPKHYYQLSIYFMTIEPITKVQFTTEANWIRNYVEISDVSINTFRLTLNPY